MSCRKQKITNTAREVPACAGEVRAVFRRNESDPGDGGIVMKYAVSINNVSKTFSEWRRKPVNGNPMDRWLSFLRWEKKQSCAVKGVTLQIEPGEIFGILGANGSGKSTLIRIVSTLLLPDQGSVSVYGYDVVENELAVRKLINRVSVEASFFKKLSARENLAFASRLYGYTPSESWDHLVEICDYLGLPEDKLSESVENLSRGMQQKVAIARALFTTPSLLLLDEPTTGLDPKSKMQVQSFVRKINKEKNITTILTTHDMNEAESLCDRIAIMRDGEIIALGTASELKERVNSQNTSSSSVKNLEEVFLKLAEEGN